MGNIKNHCCPCSSSILQNSNMKQRKIRQSNYERDNYLLFHQFKNEMKSNILEIDQQNIRINQYLPNQLIQKTDNIHKVASIKFFYHLGEKKQLQTNHIDHQDANQDNKIIHSGPTKQQLQRQIIFANSQYNKTSQYVDEKRKILLDMNIKLEAVQSQYINLKESKHQEMNHQYHQNRSEIQLVSLEILTNHLRDEKIKQNRNQLLLHQTQVELKRQLLCLQQRLKQLTQQYQYRRQELNSKELEKYQLEKRIQHLKQTNNKKQGEYREFKLNFTTRNYNLYFAGDVLDGSNDMKQFLITFLEKKTKNNIISTKLIYRFDVYNKTNIHKYIDKQENLVLIIKLLNGHILGGWNQGAFSPDMKSDRDGAIFSLTNKIAFRLSHHNKGAITYNDKYVIYGDSELKIGFQDTNIFCNFGDNNGFYNYRGMIIDMLLGDHRREVKFAIYEFFRLKFSS